MYHLCELRLEINLLTYYLLILEISEYHTNTTLVTQ